MLDSGNWSGGSNGTFYTITGALTSGGTPLSGATVSLSGSQSGSVVTGSGGTYSFTVPAGGSYTVGVSETNYSFSPTSASIPNVQSNQTANFSGTGLAYISAVGPNDTKYPLEFYVPNNGSWTFLDYIACPDGADCRQVSCATGDSQVELEARNVTVSRVDWYAMAPTTAMPIRTIIVCSGVGPSVGTLIVYDAAPNVTSVTPSQFTQGQGLVAVRIQGSNLGQGGSISITPPQVLLQGVQAWTPGEIDATFNVTSAALGTYTVTVTETIDDVGQSFAPMQQNQNTGSKQITVTPIAPPTISGEQGIWWFGTNANYGGPDLPGYWDTTLLTVTPGIGSPPPSDASPALWSVSPSDAGRYVSITPLYSDHHAVALSVDATPVGCAYIQVQVAVQGVWSSPYLVVIDQPVSVAFVRARDDPWNLVPVYPGYLSRNTLRLTSSCGQAISSVSVNETFPGSCAACSADWDGTGVVRPSVSWDSPPARADWSGWRTTPAGDINIAPGTFDDTVGFAFPPPGATPPSQVPPAPPAQASGPPTGSCEQVFYVGSQQTGQGFPLVPDQQVSYTDHGRDELWNWTCPVH